MSEILNSAIVKVQNAKYAFCRFITANDTGKNGSHQAGFYIPKCAAALLFDTPGVKGENKDKMVKVKWQDDFTTDSRFIYYGQGTRNEYRITRFGKGFPFFEEDNVGDLLIIAQQSEDYYYGFVLQTDQDIDDFFAYFNLSPEKTTCKDRWRQVLNEADRIETKYLFTLQQGISKNQLREMKHEHLKLVVPASYRTSFDKEFQPEIETLASFIEMVKLKQNSNPIYSV